ncbi:hypothetical protein [Paraburkholderia sp.]|jgi:hypothetical protein|uniref:hypothetical protein n=1 Tax=Paraburkholderia sp. TaxID=1926495 RepID=UPI002F3E57F6
MTHSSRQYESRRAQRASNAEGDEPVHQPAPPVRNDDLPELPDPAEVGESG